jgi:hypothetical protein
MNMKVIEKYEAPLVEVIQVEVEKGFAASTEPLRKADNEIDW